MKWPWRMFSIPVGSWGWGRLRDTRANWTLLSGQQREWLEKFRLLIIRWCGGRSSSGRAIDRRLDVFADQQRWLQRHGDGRRPLRRRMRWTLRHQPAGKSSLKKNGVKGRESSNLLRSSAAQQSSLQNNQILENPPRSEMPKFWTRTTDWRTTWVKTGAALVSVTNAMERRKKKHTHTHCWPGSIRRGTRTNHQTQTHNTHTHPATLTRSWASGRRRLLLSFLIRHLPLASILAHVHLSLSLISLSLSPRIFVLSQHNLYLYILPVCAKAQLYVYVANVRVYVYLEPYILLLQVPLYKPVCYDCWVLVL